MWVSVHCWSVVPADEHVSCSQSALAPPVGHACKEQDMYTLCSSILRVEGSAFINVAMDTHTRACTHTITELTLLGEHPHECHYGHNRP